MRPSGGGVKVRDWSDAEVNLWGGGYPWDVSPGAIRAVVRILKRSDDPDGSSSGVEEFEVHD